MRKKLSLGVILALLLIGCSDNNMDISIDGITNQGNKNEIIDKDKYTNNEDNEKFFKDVIIKKNDIKIKGNEFSINNLQLRNKSIEKEYIRAISLFKEFTTSNSLEIIYEEPIQDTITIFEGNNTSVELLTNLYNCGAETIHYFTDEDILNIDLSISISAADISNITYSGVVYKASLIDNLTSGFNFEDSKLNDFRSLIVDKPSDINFEKLNLFIDKCLDGKYSNEIVFLNKLDDNSYEVVRVENNTVYYKFVYDPKL